MLCSKLRSKMAAVVLPCVQSAAVYCLVRTNLIVEAGIYQS